MTGRPGPLFVGRTSYRQRRLRDAARLLPLLGLILWLIPLLWPREPGAAQETSFALLYIFGVWAGLILLSLVLSRRLRADEDAPPGTEGD